MDKIASMIDVLGNIKLDMSKPIRIKYFLMTLLSIKDIFNPPVINIENLSDGLYYLINDFCKKNGMNNTLILGLSDTFPVIQDILLNKYCFTPYYLNFEEDHFCVLNNKKHLETIIKSSVKHDVDIIRATFYEIEIKSSSVVIYDYDDELCWIFRMDTNNFKLFQLYYNKRFYVGNNS
ncbi:MAG: hypothetical protein AABY22_07875, partial [Nanoarchaeota archaeon]